MDIHKKVELERATGKTTKAFLSNLSFNQGLSSFCDTHIGAILVGSGFWCW